MKTAKSAERFRLPMLISQFRVYEDFAYYICPRCEATIEREFMAYCDRCGQCLCWRHYKKADIMRS